MKRLLSIIIAGLLSLLLPVGIMMGAAPPKKTPQLLQGAKKLFDAISRVREALLPERFQQASALLNSIVETARKWQETGEAKKRKEEYLEEHREVSSELTFGKESS